MQIIYEKLYFPSTYSDKYCIKIITKTQKKNHCYRNSTEHHTNLIDPIDRLHNRMLYLIIIRLIFT